MAVTWMMNMLLAIGYAIGWSAVHSMLVKRMGVEYLPYTYIGISLLGVMGSSVYLAFADAVRRDRLLVIFSAATGIVLLLARMLVTARPEGETGLTVPLVLFFAAVFFAQGVGNSTLGTQVWTIINDIFRPSQGRRLYPIIGTAGTIGGIVGGASIHFLASSLGTANLILIWAGTTWTLIPLTWWLRKHFGAELRGRKGSTEHPASGRLREGWSFFLSSKMAVTLGFVAVMFWIVGSVADFQYTRIMNATFPHESELAGYYGLYGMVINISGLFVQMFFSGYLIRRIGVGRGLCALPATVLAGFALIAAWFAFWPGIILRYTWDMVGMTVQGNSYQLALNAIPGALRARMRGFIDGVVNPLGGVLGGVLILSLHHLFDSKSGSGWTDPVTIAGLVLALVWLVVVSRSQKHYMGLVAENLGSTDHRTAMDAVDCLEEPGNHRAAELLAQAAASPDVEIRTAVARVRGNIGGEQMLAALAPACADAAASVRAEALRAIVRAQGNSPLPPERETLIEQVLENDPDPSVRAEALKALLFRQPVESGRKIAARWLSHSSPLVRTRMVEAVGRIDWDSRTLLTPSLADESPQVRAAAAHTLWAYEEMRPAIRLALTDLLASESSAAHAAALASCHRIGECPDAAAPARLLNSSDPAVRVLAGAGVIRFQPLPAARDQALARIFEVLSDPAHADMLRGEVLPLVPDLGEEASDAILLGASKLGAEEKKRVSLVLGDWYRVLEARVQPLN